VRKSVGIVFSTESARTTAESILLQKINCEVFIVAPPELVPDNWVKTWTQHCKGWTVRYFREGILERPIEVLAQIDELCVIADRKHPKHIFDLAIPESIEELLWLAMELRLDVKYFFQDGLRLSNPETTLQKRKVPQRVMVNRNLREAFTQQLKEIRLSCEYYSCGLWNDKGLELGYDQLDLPFALLRRIAAWQRDFDETEIPPATGDEAWRKRHALEEISIARGLQAALGNDLVVKLYRKDAWISIDKINCPEGDES
jgi:hypothetical protein